MSHWSEPEVREAIEVIVASGMPVGAWTILSRSNRLVLMLRPSGLIAKVVRIGDSARLAREFAVARHVAAQDGPAVPPAPGTAVLLGQAVAVTLWEPAGVLAPPADPTICRAYLDLRRCLDSYPGALPDFREAISQVTGLLNARKFPHLSDEDAARLRACHAASFAHLSEFSWTNHVLHGDPHAGNVASTRQGSRWLDFESACVGPVEWDLSALPEGSRVLTHDPALLTHLTRLRRTCVVAWCASRTHPDAAENAAIAYHLAIIRAEASG